MDDCSLDEPGGTHEGIRWVPLRGKSPDLVRISGEATEHFRWERQNAANYWREHSAKHLPPDTPLPDHLNPATIRPAEDWQVAMRLRPIKLDRDGHPALGPTAGTRHVADTGSA